jgi:hypothetical protein
MVRPANQGMTAQWSESMKSPDNQANPTDSQDQKPVEFRRVQSRIMYLEDKSQGLEGPARIGRVYFSKSGRTLYYRDQAFRSLKGAGFKSNYYEVSTGHEYWISGPRKDQQDRLYGGQLGVLVDDDVHEAYLAYING